MAKRYIRIDITPTGRTLLGRLSMLINRRILGNRLNIPNYRVHGELHKVITLCKGYLE